MLDEFHARHAIVNATEHNLTTYNGCTQKDVHISFTSHASAKAFSIAQKDTRQPFLTELLWQLVQ